MDAITFPDKLRTLRLVADSASAEAQAVAELNGTDKASLEYLRGAGFSEKSIDGFYRPFYGGILLDRTLSTSSRVLRFTFKMLAAGKTAVPARGIGGIPDQLAAHLSPDAIHLNSPVDELLRDGAQVSGVRSGGVEHEADAVVVATESPAVRGLAGGGGMPEAAVGQTCIYYAAGANGLGGGRKILLNAESGGFLNNVVEMSAVSEDYSPPGRSLVGAVALGSLDLPNDELYRRGIAEISTWYPEVDLEPLAVYRIPFAQFDQPPGVHERLPENRTSTPGLVLAGEYTEDSSINGAMLSGEKAADVVTSR